jgi:hypothetical protein
MSSAMGRDPPQKSIANRVERRPRMDEWHDQRSTAVSTTTGVIDDDAATSLLVVHRSIARLVAVTGLEPGKHALFSHNLRSDRVLRICLCLLCPSLLRPRLCLLIEVLGEELAPCPAK